MAMSTRWEKREAMPRPGATLILFLSEILFVLNISCVCCDTVREMKNSGIQYNGVISYLSSWISNEGLKGQYKVGVIYMHEIISIEN